MYKLFNLIFSISLFHFFILSFVDINEVNSLINKGDFKKARKIILYHLKSKRISKSEQKKLMWLNEKMRRIKIDFRYTRDDIIKQLQQKIKNFNITEFDKWLTEGKLSFKIIDGKYFFFNSCVSNLFFRYPEIRARRINSNGKTPLLWDLVNSAQKVPSFCKGTIFAKYKKRNLKFSLYISKTLNVNDKISVWIPYPKYLPYQKDIELIDYSDGLKSIAPYDWASRSVFFEKKYFCEKDKKFFVLFHLNTAYRFVNVNLEEVKEIYPENVKLFLQEKKPHIVFLKPLKETVKKIVENEKNPYLKAYKIYRWIGNNFKYSYAQEYSTIDNISYETFKRKYGDCGEIALLFITMCRIAGVPARWQSGWMLYPSHIGLHDWTEIYIYPYGWLPVDPWVPVAFNSEDFPDKKKKENTIKFYFGNMDNNRLYINSDISIPFIPPKKDFRSDTVDFQRGEVEVNDKNVYYPGFKYKLEVLWQE